MNKLFGVLFFILLFTAQGFAFTDNKKQTAEQWTDSVYRSLTPEERIAQLVWVAASAGDNIEQQIKTAELIRNFHPGGMIFFEGDLKKQIRLTNYLQSISKTPLLIAMDAEWGPGMRLSGTLTLPYAMALGAIQDQNLIMKSGEEAGRQLKQIGVQVNLAPDADINTEPHNPIIGMRSFGESPQNVTRCATAMMQGMLNAGIIPVAKHFPGHGDTQNDSHLTLPVLPYSRERLESTELVPFRELINAGIPAIMSAHLNVPALDSTKGIPATLSPLIINNILRKSWGFKGLIITDAMNMQGVRSYGAPGTIDVLALKAGNDVVEFPADPKETILAITRALKTGELKWNDIEQKCKRVLLAKYQVGLNSYKAINPSGIEKILNTPQSELLNRQLSEASLTLLENQRNIIPLQGLDTLHIASVSIGSDSITTFQKGLSRYSDIDHFNLPDNFTAKEADQIFNQIKNYNLVIVGIHNLYEMSNRKTVKVGNIKHVSPQYPYNATPELEQFLSSLSGRQRTIITLFGNPYALAEFKHFSKPQALLIAYQDDPVNEDLCAQLIYGGISAQGKLPVSITGLYKAGEGLSTPNPIRFKYTIAEEVGLNSARINTRVDSIVNLAIRSKAFPGCQVFVAKDRKVIFHKAYGFHTYDKVIPVSLDDRYDLASNTKITGPLSSYMKLYDEGKFQIDDQVSKFWPDWKKRLFHKSNKEDITFREVLSHQAGLIPYIGFWNKTLRKDKTPDPKWYSPFKDEKYSLAVTPNLFLDQKFSKEVYKQIRLSPLKNRGKYIYSDLSFILAPEIIKNISGENYVTFVTQNIYQPLGANSITYNPFEKVSLDKIPPTEYDHVFRHQLVQGSVHDESAAVLGGISGNAGLFATANDMGKLIQMYLQKGTYGGHEFFSEKTFNTFNTVQYPQTGNRRALGFDKPLLNNAEVSVSDAYPIKDVSPESFGHSGFTGTFVWADPKYGLVYVFLSNHIYPTRENMVIFNQNVRTNILQVFYDEVKK